MLIQIYFSSEDTSKITVGGWMAQSAKLPTLDFASGCDFRVLRLSPESGMESAGDSLLPSAPPLPS